MISTLDTLVARESSRRALRSLLAPVERTALALGLVQFALHAAFALASRDPRIFLPHLVAWIQDLGLLSLVVVLASIMARVGKPWWNRLVAAVSWVALLALGTLLAIYPRMLQSSLAFPVNVFNTDPGTAGVFLRDYLGWAGLWPAGVALLAGIAAPWLGFPRLPCKRVLIGAVLSLTLVTALGEAPNPVVFSLQDKLSELVHASGRVVPRLVPGLASGGAAFKATPSPLEVDQPMKYDRVLLLVLEGVTASAFESEFLHRPGGFAQRYAAHARYFRRYYTLNLDSYTSLISMTTSVAVPFRSYADPARYDVVNTLPNAPRALKKKGYSTLFVSTYEGQPFVPNRADWDRIADRRDLPTLNGFTSLGSSRMEAATEDRAAIPLILAQMASSPRTLVLAELVYGHSPQWQAVTGVTQLAYYDAYLTELIDGVAREGLAQRTLTIIVSDHGVRSAPADPENYRVPLLVLGGGVVPGEDDELRSHLDLQCILAHYLMGTPLPAARIRLTAVGSTERWVYGEIAPPSDYVFIDDRTGQVLSRGGSLEPADVHRRFQAQVDLVDAIKAQP